jgi:catechol 2,3-dioxygenase-like lactoylglutathione lyase family enzyme
VHLRHLGLPVRDYERSLRFYATYFGFDGVPIIERDDEPDLVSFKCLDPDGWRVEVYWEPS